jgi:hypothetical protein
VGSGEVKAGIHERGDVFFIDFAVFLAAATFTASASPRWRIPRRTFRRRRRFPRRRDVHGFCVPALANSATYFSSTSPFSSPPRRSRLLRPRAGEYRDVFFVDVAVFLAAATFTASASPRTDAAAMTARKHENTQNV